MAPNKQAQTSETSREVNNLLHTLRGEHFRHTQNLQRAIARTLNMHSYTNPSLPFDQIYAEKRPTTEQPNSRRNYAVMQLGPEGILEYAYPRGPVPGPLPPRSWSGLFDKGKEKEVDECSKRAEALSLILSHLPPTASTERSMPPLPLTTLCLRYLLSLFPESGSADMFREDIVPYVPAHLRRDLLRWTAIHKPLSSSRLSSLCSPDGHAEGELIVVGPQASPSRDLLRPDVARRRATRMPPDVYLNDSSSDPDWSWDSPSSDVYTRPPLYALILLTTPVSVNTLLSFPPTLTHLALIALPSAAPIHRLPRLCPLIEVLDLSFNTWLKQEAGDDTILERVEWERWRRLRVLGLRDCNVDGSVADRVNKGRWTDVEVVGVDSGAPSLEAAMSRLRLNG